MVLINLFFFCFFLILIEAARGIKEKRKNAGDETFRADS